MLPGFYPFWFWNDRLEPEEIRWQIREMARQGVRGFFIHPRQGLEQPYLSERFMALVEVAVDEARRQGMVANLYDEYPYPSGIAGGEVVIGSPEYRATQLEQRQFDASGGELLRIELPRGKVLSARAYPLREGVVDWREPLDLLGWVGMSLTRESYVETGLTRYNQKRFFSSHPAPVLETELPPGSWRIFASVQVEVTHHKYWGHFVDVLNPQAVGAFLQLTHERYARRFHSEFGKTIQAIFTDETHPGWSARIPPAFEQAYGYNLLDHLEALQDPTYPDAARITGDLSRLVYEMFINAFERPLAEWCRAHGILYCGEKPYQRLAQAQYMDIPGCEPGHTKAGAALDLLGPNARGNARATASAAYFYGKPGALDECYHSLGWSGTLQDAKLMADAMTLLGIRYLVPHGFFYSTHALRKHDAPPTFFFQMPYWPFFGRLSQRLERLWEQFEGTYIAAEVLVVDPTAGLPQHADKAAYVELQQRLMERQIEFLHVDTGILRAGQVEKGTLRVRNINARAVIVPPMPVIEPELVTWLELFEQHGGEIIRCAAGCDPTAVVDELLACGIRPSLTIRNITNSGQPAAPSENPIWCVCRTDGSRTVWFLINTAGKALEVEIDAGEPLVEMPLEDGAQPELAAAAHGRYRRNLAPFESILLRSGDGFTPPESLTPVTLHMEGALKVRPLNANLLRMSHWQMALYGTDGAPGISATVPAVPIANQLAISGLPFAPKIEQAFGVEPRLALPLLRARYTFAFHNDYSGAVRLVMEPGSLRGDWQLWVNEHGPFGEPDFGPSDAHVRGSLELDITAHLRQGENSLRIELQTERTDGGLLNPLYLAGDFGVFPGPGITGEPGSLSHLPRLAQRQPTGGFETYEENGLPFYAGVVEYRLAFAYDRPDGNHQPVSLELAATRPCHEAMEISINGGEFLPVLWEPRRVRVPAEQLRDGQNEATVRVYTTLIRSFEGQRFDEEGHCYIAL